MQWRSCKPLSHIQGPAQCFSTACLADIQMTCPLRSIELRMWFLNCQQDICKSIQRRNRSSSIFLYIPWWNKACWIEAPLSLTCIFRVQVPRLTLFIILCRYDSDDTPMREYANVHDFLQKKRAAALSAGSDGPRTMVCTTPELLAAEHQMAIF